MKPTILAAMATWVVCSMLCGVTSKQLLSGLPCPYTLTAAQMTVAYACHMGYERWRRQPVAPGVTLSDATQLTLLCSALAFSIGISCLNGGFGLMHVSISETLRALEPLITVFMATTCLSNEAQVSRLRMLALLPIICGVGLSAKHNAAFHFLGFAMVMVANVVFPIRSLLVKQLQRTLPLDYIFSMTLGYGMLFQWLGMGVSWAFGGPLGGLFNAKQALLSLANGCAFYAYHIASYSVLHQTDMTTHAVVNALRRVLTILFSVYCFQVPLALGNALGMVIACAGALMYAYALRQESRLLVAYDSI
ncbi:plastid phosphate/phosphoenolpyruvate translocator1 [Achlya hypogyna]|uniref:Plastid phosphate/phosphoenolpyruvate translocator1 n=1 Tax=Achlya hypogyna TaxID=1202772 RepID=A0A1V9YK41_ACHHY|nr:plastid phosphate/phosphoenolpyruvate translocator1 [Achlya hypogyna]